MCNTYNNTTNNNNNNNDNNHDIPNEDAARAPGETIRPGEYQVSEGDYQARVPERYMCISLPLSLSLYIYSREVICIVHVSRSLYAYIYIYS